MDRDSDRAVKNAASFLMRGLSTTTRGTAERLMRVKVMRIYHRHCRRWGYTLAVPGIKGLALRIFDLILRENDETTRGYLSAVYTILNEGKGGGMLKGGIPAKYIVYRYLRINPDGTRFYHLHLDMLPLVLGLFH